MNSFKEMFLLPKNVYFELVKYLQPGERTKAHECNAKQVNISAGDLIASQKYVAGGESENNDDRKGRVNHSRLFLNEMKPSSEREPRERYTNGGPAFEVVTKREDISPLESPPPRRDPPADPPPPPSYLVPSYDSPKDVKAVLRFNKTPSRSPRIESLSKKFEREDLPPNPPEIVVTPPKDDFGGAAAAAAAAAVPSPSSSRKRRANDEEIYATLAEVILPPDPKDNPSGAKAIFEQQAVADPTLDRVVSPKKTPVVPVKKSRVSANASVMKQAKENVVTTKRVIKKPA